VNAYSKRLRHGRSILECIRFVHDTTIKQMYNPSGVVCIARIVGDDADRGASGMKLGEQRHHRFAVPGIQVARGLIG
jgi:hypothetical protein